MTSDGKLNQARILASQVRFDAISWYENECGFADIILLSALIDWSRPLLRHCFLHHRLLPMSQPRRPREQALHFWPSKDVVRTNRQGEALHLSFRFEKWTLCPDAKERVLSGRRLGPGSRRYCEFFKNL